MDVRLMPKPSNRCKQKAHLSWEAHFQIWIKYNEGKLFFFLGLTCMDKLFTTEIAKCANEINSQF